jgi:redox-sensitive bicupin YhaK (pirin superfamily)
MLTLRPSAERGHANHGWLDTYHSFSFADYYDPQQMGFRTLRVINEDRVAPGQGFGTHPHRDMEIITYIVEGSLGHRDNMNHEERIERGDVQVMTAGRGLMHSEYNHEEFRRTHLLQIWILPNQKGLQPSYDQKRFPESGKRNALQLLVSGDGRGESLFINQDADLYASILEEGGTLEHRIADGRHAWVQLISGAIAVNGVAMAPGDGLAVSEEELLRISASKEAEFLLFDLA